MLAGYRLDKVIKSDIWSVNLALLAETWAKLGNTKVDYKQKAADCIILYVDYRFNLISCQIPLKYSRKSKKITIFLNPCPFG